MSTVMKAPVREIGMGGEEGGAGRFVRPEGRMNGSGGARAAARGPCGSSGSS